MKYTFLNLSILYCCIIALFIALAGCSNDTNFEAEVNKPITLDLSGESIQLSPANLVKEGSNSNYISRIDSITVYGFGVQQIIPDSIKDFDLKFVFTGKMRNTESTNGYISLSLYNQKDSIIMWQDIVAEKHITTLNTWTPFKDSLIINKSLNNLSAQYIRIFTRKIIGKGFFEVDDLKVEIITLKE